MNRTQKAFLLIAAIALPAAAHSAFTPKDAACFVSGTSTYRIASATDAPDFRVKIASEPGDTDLRMRLVDRAELADFVLVDDFSAGKPAPCRSSTPIRTVKLDDQSPDVTVRLSANGPADFTIYVHSVRFSQHDAAALLAAIWKADRRREFAAARVVR